MPKLSLMRISNAYLCSQGFLAHVLCIQCKSIAYGCYINDLSQAIQYTMIAIYADDISLSYRFDDVNQMNETMNKGLTHAFERLKVYMYIFTF